jgi:amino acid transporter/mannitol/fructose-specific phosphotransferase system IIA component (Ntr-type)
MSKNKKRLKRDISLLGVFCIASGAMISSGLFILPGIASAEVGPALFLSYILASLFALPTVLSMAELVTAMPKAGGDYFFITRSMGPIAGTIGGLSTWFSLSLKSAFALIGMSAYLSLIPIFSVYSIKLVGAFLCLLFMGINLKGTKHAGRFQIGLVVFLLGLLFLYVIEGFTKIHISRYTPFTPYGTSSVFAAAGLIFISYGGITKIASMAEEIDNPTRNIPLGMFLSLIIVGLLYAVVVFVTTGVLDQNLLSGSLTPISDAASITFGTLGAITMAIAAILAFVSTANAGIMSASRYPLAMSRDNLMPSFLKKIHSKHKTPYNAIITTTLFMISAILFLELELLVKAASVFLILIYILINIALIIMKESKIANYRPTYRCPLYPYLQIIAIAGGIFLLVEMGKAPLLIAASFVALGLIWYLFYGKLSFKKDPALIHLVERITSKELAGDSLRVELKSIIKERDGIYEDRFDYLIKEAGILDIEHQLDMKTFFRVTAGKLAEDMDEGPDYFYRLLMEREKESSTVIHEGLAIPHIITAGKNEFKIILARCKEGVIFEDADKPVQIIFVLAGSKDERNFHLRVLSAIAQIVQSEKFKKLWLQAKNAEELRDVILLAERTRI